MKLYNKDIPDTNEVVFVKIKDYDDNYGTINVAISEYNELDGMIIYSNIHKKLNKVKLFLKKRENSIFPCSVYNLEDDATSKIVYLEPLKIDDEIKAQEKRFKIQEHFNNLSNFLIANNNNEEELIKEKFLWKLVENTDYSDDKINFDYFLENLDELFLLTELEKNLIEKYKKQIEQIIQINDIVYSINFTLELFSNYGLENLNKILNMIYNNVKTLTYIGGHYKLVINGKNLDFCRDEIENLKLKIKEYCMNNLISKYNLEFDFRNEKIDKKNIVISY